MRAADRPRARFGAACAPPRRAAPSAAAKYGIVPQLASPVCFSPIEDTHRNVGWLATATSSHDVAVWCLDLGAAPCCMHAYLHDHLIILLLLLYIGTTTTTCHIAIGMNSVGAAARRSGPATTVVGTCTGRAVRHQAVLLQIQLQLQLQLQH